VAQFFFLGGGHDVQASAVVALINVFIVLLKAYIATLYVCRWGGCWFADTDCII